jgi:hypothetical protein
MTSQLSVHERRDQLETEIAQHWAGLLSDAVVERAVQDLAEIVYLARLQLLDGYRFTLRIDGPHSQTLVASADVAAGIRIAAAATFFSDSLYLSVVVIDEELGSKEVARALLYDDGKAYTYTGETQRAGISDTRRLTVVAARQHPSVDCHNLSGQIQWLVASYTQLQDMDPSWFTV